MLLFLHVYVLNITPLLQVVLRLLKFWPKVHSPKEVMSPVSWSF